MRPGIRQLCCTFRLGVIRPSNVLLFKVFDLITQKTPFCLLTSNQGHLVSRGIQAFVVHIPKEIPARKLRAKPNGHDLVTEDKDFFLTTVAVDAYR